MPGLTINLTGQVPAIVRAARSVGVAALQRRQTRIALAVLVLERETPPSKHRLADILWPDELPATWETALRGIVARVRALLVEAGLSESAVASTSTGLRVTLPARAAVDVEVAGVEVAVAEAALTRGEHERAYAAASAVCAVVDAPLLPDCDGEWVQQWRDRLAAWRQRALIVAAESATAVGRYPDAVTAAEDALRADPYAEWAFRTLMRVREASGERAAALDAYERCRRRLRDDLGVSPSPETEAAYLALLGAGPASRDSRLPLVGRQSELHVLAAQWAQVCAGGPRGVVLVGEPGAGKSRLAADFAESLQAAGHLVLRGREDGLLSVPFRPFADALADYVAARGSQILDEAGATSELARLRVEPAEEALARQHGAASQWQLFEAVRTWMTVATRVEPIAFVVEDLQWATPTSVSLLRHLLADQNGMRLLVVATCRVDDAAHPELASALASLLTTPTVQRVAPAPLTDGQVDELLDAAVGTHLPRLATAIADRTAGNPLYAVQTIRHLLARRQQTGSLDVGPLDLPAALSELVQLRLRSLGPSWRPVLELAALAGAQVDVDVLVGASGDPDVVGAALARAAGLGLVSRDGTTVTFHHDVLREAVDATVTDTHRSTLHRALALAFDARDRDDELPRRAHHWHHAAELGDAEAENAIRAHRAAARQATARLAFDRAAQHLTAARTLLDTCDPAEIRLSERCDLTTELGAVMHHAGDARHVDALRDARELAYRLDDPVRLARATLAGVHWGATQTAIVEDTAIMTALANAVRELPAQEQELRARVEAALALETRWSQPSAAAALADKAVEDARRAGRPETIAAVLVARQTLGRLQPDEELADTNELRQIAAGVSDPTISCEAAVIAFDARLRRGEPARADAELSTLERIADRAGLPYFRWVALTRRAGWHVLRGNDEADAVVEQASDLGTEIGIHPTLIHASRTGQQFVVHMTRGRAADAAAALAVIEPFAGQDASWQSTMAVALAESGDRGAAAQLFDSVISSRLDAVADDQLGLLTLICLAWAAARLQDPRAALLTPRLALRSGQLSWIASFSLGPVDLALAWAATACGELDIAADHLDVASRLAKRAHADPWLELIEREQAGPYLD